MTIVEFLLARIAEDEAQSSLVVITEVDVSGGVPEIRYRAIRSRVLAECEAKRRIVELSWHHLGEEDYGWGMEEAKRQILALLALPYADHPDYDEAWRP